MALAHEHIVLQVSAVRAALVDITQVIIEDLVEYYVSQTTDAKGKIATIELKDTVSRILYIDHYITISIITCQVANLVDTEIQRSLR